MGIVFSPPYPPIGEEKESQQDKKAKIDSSSVGLLHGTPFNRSVLLVTTGNNSIPCPIHLAPRHNGPTTGKELWSIVNWRCCPNCLFLVEMGRIQQTQNRTTSRRIITDGQFGLLVLLRTQRAGSSGGPQVLLLLLPPGNGQFSQSDRPKTSQEAAAGLEETRD